MRRSWPARARRSPSSPIAAHPNLRLGGIGWPIFAIVGGLATGASFLVILAQNPTTRWVGLGWLGSGFVAYVIYRRRFVHVARARP